MPLLKPERVANHLPHTYEKYMRGWKGWNPWCCMHRALRNDFLFVLILRKENNQTIVSLAQAAMSCLWPDFKLQKNLVLKLFGMDML